MANDKNEQKLSAPLAVAEFLPDIELPAQSERAVRLRPPAGRTTVLVSVHSPTCEACLRYAEELASSALEFEAWEARLLIAVPAAPAAVQGLRPEYGIVLADANCRVSSPDDAAVVVADRYGQIYAASHAGESHRLPAPRELEEWLKFLGTQCPE